MNGLIDIMIADITTGHRNRCFAEIGPHRKNPLYGTYTVYSKTKAPRVQKVKQKLSDHIAT